MNQFIPNKIDKCIISLRLSCALLADIDLLAAKIDISRNDLVNQCIEFALTHYCGQEKDTDKNTH